MDLIACAGGGPGSLEIGAATALESEELLLLLLLWSISHA